MDGCPFDLALTDERKVSVFLKSAAMDGCPFDFAFMDERNECLAPRMNPDRVTPRHLWSCCNEQRTFAGRRRGRQ